MTPSQQVSTQVLARLSKLGITQAELATRLGLARVTVTNALNGRRNLTLQTIKQITQALDMDLTITFRAVEKLDYPTSQMP